MTTFRITNTKSGLTLGDYEAESADGAFVAMMRDAGYPDATIDDKEPGVEVDEVADIVTSFVTDGSGRYLVQLPADNEHGFVLADDDQTWAGGLGSGWSEWTTAERADVPADVEERLGWLLDT